MVGVERGGRVREEWRGTGVRGKEALVSGLTLEVLPFNIPFLTEKVTSYTYPPTEVSLSLRASKSELEDVVFLVGWLGAIYKLYGEFPKICLHFWDSRLFCVLIYMVCGHEGPGVPSNVPVIT